MSESDLIDLYRIARACTDAGYYQAAKLFYAAAASLINRQLYREALPKTEDDLVLAIDEIEPRLDRLKIDSALLETIHQVSKEIASGHMNFIPPVYVCRACGQVALKTAPNYCPNCGAGQLTFQYFAATYYLEPEPIDSTLAQLAATPDWLDRILANVSVEQLKQKVSGAEGEWSLSEAAGHLLDSQQLIEQRVDLFMSNEAPNLSAKSARELIDSAGLPAQALTLAFRKSRSHMLAELKAAPAAYWERIGQHAEFGPVTLQQQVTYFAKHEHWHMAQMTRIHKAFG